MDNLKYINFTMLLFAATMCLIFTFCISLGTKSGKKSIKWMAVLEVMTAFLLFFDAFAWYFRGYPGQVGYWMVRITNFMVFFISAELPVAFVFLIGNMFEESGVEEKIMTYKRVKAELIMGFIAGLLVIISQFTNLYYSFDSANFYSREKWHCICLLLGLTQIFIIFSLVLQFRKKMSKRLFFAITVYVALPILASIVLLFYYGLSLVNYAIWVSMVLLFIEYEYEETEMNRKNEKELFEATIQIMLSQLGPHFIFNALTAIKYLCRTSPEDAIETVECFANYLRGNLDAISGRKTIRFEEELEHIKQYIYIEQKRFGNRVSIIYDLECTEFEIPTLVLQPLVENAVKHGITKRERGGIITISSRREEGYYSIKVADDGVGFDIKAWENQDGRYKYEGPEDSLKKDVHVGIHSVQNRLKQICGGSLIIKSDPENGTEAEIMIPR